MNPPKDIVHLLNAVGEAGRTRLQNVGRLHFEDSVVLNGRYSAPSLASDDGFLPQPLAAPGREDHFRIAASDLVWIDNAIFGEPGV